ncbi:hypothetical protein ScPMuIL_018263 [Solemya velum]
MQGGDGLYSRMTNAQLFKDQNLDKELEHKAKKVTEKFTDCLNIVANEPSLAFFRIQEHVQKTVPRLVEQKHEFQDLQQSIQGACFDAEYATNAVKAMDKSQVHFQNIQELIKNAMFMKQQIEYEQDRRNPELLDQQTVDVPSQAPVKKSPGEPSQHTT